MVDGVNRLKRIGRIIDGRAIGRADWRRGLDKWRKNWTHRSTVVPCRKNHRRRRPFTLILGSARVQNGHQTGTQRELKNPTPTFTFPFILWAAHRCKMGIKLELTKTGIELVLT
jgi:hypothetical protein